MRNSTADGTFYDGVFFYPRVDEDDNEFLTLNYWSYQDKYADKKSIENTKLGNKFFVAFFKEEENGNYVVDDVFEAIFADPSTYLDNLVGSDLFGVICRKTENSESWFKSYLNEVKQKLKKLNSEVDDEK